MSPDLGHMPSALRANARWERIGGDGIPVMLVMPDWDADAPPPVVLWMHGRTVNKELDPGRYLRWMRAGIGACAIDLPGHGERLDARLQQPENTLEVVLQMASEIDDIASELDAYGFDACRMAIGGMSAGGMATLVRLCREHPFHCASIEASSGSWRHQLHREMFTDMSEADILKHDPIQNLADWREIPIQFIHSKHDEWMAIESQHEFAQALRDRYDDPGVVEMTEFDRTGAPFEHAGFGTKSAEAKTLQARFFQLYLLNTAADGI